VGLIFDGNGNRFTPAHAVKNGKRYRYYVSQLAIKNPGSSQSPRSRIPAGDVERLILTKLQEFLQSPRDLLDALSERKEKAVAARTIVAAAHDWASRITSVAATETRALMHRWVSRITVCSRSVDILIDRRALRQTLLGYSGSLTPGPNEQNGLITLTSKAQLQRFGGEVRFTLVPNSSDKLQSRTVPSLIKAVARAQKWFEQIVRGEQLSCRSVAQAEGLDERYVSRILQFAFLAPDIVKSIVNGRQPASLSLEHFRTHLPISWDAQRRQLGLPPNNS
jgi:hypothetical protein